MAAATASSRELVMGVDFGTSYSSAGVLIDGKVELVLDDGENTIPSAVHVPRRGEPIFGAKALAHLTTDPANTVTSVKRLMGRRFDDPAIKRYQQWAPFRLKRGPQDKVLLELGGTDYACEQVASWILKRLRELAEARFGGRVRRAVVAVPASATEPYETALGTAARLAGFEIVQRIPEPIAGALAVGLHVVPAARRLLVCDFGGGTFDATLIDQDQLHFNALGCDGDEFLGGDDFDVILAQAVAGGVFEKTGFEMQRDVVRAHQLLRRCESVKRQLSARDDTSLLIKDGYIKGGKSYDVNATIARSWIEPRWEPLVDRAVAACQRLLVRNRRTAADISHVVLVGGATLMPLVRRKVAEAFPAAETVTGGYAQIAIAAGAVLQTAPYTASTAQIPRLAAPR